MAGKKHKEETKPKATSKAPVYLPTANPPKPHLGFLIVMAAIVVIWFGLLAYLALQQAGTI